MCRPASVSPHLVDRFDHEVADRLADDLRVGVEGGDDVEALRREAGIAQHRTAELTDTDDDHRPGAVQAEDLVQLLQQALHVIPTALLAEAAEVAEVLPDLGGGDAKLRPQLLRADDVAADAVEGRQGPCVDGQAVDDDIGDFDGHDAPVLEGARLAAEIGACARSDRLRNFSQM